MPSKWTLANALEWAQDLDDHDLRWHLILLADDVDFHHGFQRRAIIHETLSRMGQNV